MSESIEIRTIIGNRNINAVTDTPVTDPASLAKGLDGSNAFVCQRSKMDTKTSALKKSSRYRSRSLSASSTDSYSSGKYGTCYKSLIYFNIADID
uniref:Adenosylhomocysteinase-like 1 n=1 Tax=Diabrotica virgifera virgifera TaxID=50390 RepID=A0A6P7G3W9_DIAVI